MGVSNIYVRVEDTKIMPPRCCSLSDEAPNPCHVGGAVPERRIFCFNSAILDHEIEARAIT
jgi:hypothetical protein